MNPLYSWDLDTGKIEPVDFVTSQSEVHAQESAWEDALDEILLDLQMYLSDLSNVDEMLTDVAGMLRVKHHDYGEDNLRTFGELGILVRASDKVARLKNLLDKETQVADESRADTWRDLAGYAIQALIIMKAAKDTEKVSSIEMRKNRLIRGICPDCGEGVLLRRSRVDSELICSQHCGFATGSLYELCLEHADFMSLIHCIAAQAAVKVQK